MMNLEMRALRSNKRSAPESVIQTRNPVEFLWNFIVLLFAVAISFDGTEGRGTTLPEDCERGNMRTDCV